MDSQTKGNIVVGAIVSFVFAAYAGGPLIGGALAGYLEDSDLRSGSRVGVMAGIVALIASVVLAVGNLLLGITAGYGLMHIIFAGIFEPIREGIIPLVVLPLVGGGIGAYMRRETAE
mgnify:CR=1 FL=1